MKTLELKEANAPLAAYARHLSKGPVVVTRGGKPMAVLVAVKNADWETLTLSTHPKFQALIDRARARHEAGKGLSTEEMRARLKVPKPRVRRPA